MKAIPIGKLVLSAALFATTSTLFVCVIFDSRCLSAVLLSADALSLSRRIKSLVSMLYTYVAVSSYLL